MEGMRSDLAVTILLSCLIVGGFLGYGFVNGSPEVGYTALDLVGFGLAGLLWLVYGIGRLAERQKTRR